MTTHGLLDAQTDPQAVASWWDRWPTANIGLRTGIAFDVLDVDGPEGLSSLQQVAPDYRHPGPVSATGRGWHLLFAPTNAKNGANLRPKLDFRGQNGYIVAPPSIHPSGSIYTWAKSDDLPLPLPEFWLLDLVFPVPRYRTSPKATTSDYATDDLLTVLGQLGFQGRPRGPRIVGQCPFPDHNDGTPSFTVYPNNTFYCFGCHRWGDAGNVKDYIAGRGRLT